MVRVIGALAALLGYIARFMLLALPPMFRLVAILLITYGVWLFDERLAFIISGAILLLYLQPTDRRKS